MAFSSWLRNEKCSKKRACRPNLEALEDRTLLSTFTVINTQDSGAGSLRQAILDANAANTGTQASPDLIQFNIPTTDSGYQNGVFTIKPSSYLPTISDIVTVDGYTQPGASANTNWYNTVNHVDNAVIKIELSGANLTGNDEFNNFGLAISSNYSTVRGLAIDGFGGSNLYVTGSHDKIQGNFIGTNAAGTSTAFQPNLSQITAVGDVGIHINGGTGDIIGTNNDGTSDPAERNIIAGANYGIALRTTTNCVVAGNFIGTDITGTKALPNWVGIGTLLNASGDHIGTGIAGEGNIICGNAGGIAFSVGGDNTTPAETNGQVVGNSIGVDVNGNKLGNISAGIFAGVASSNITIGGTQANLANTIANTQSTGAPGVWIVDFRGVPTGIRVQGNSIYGNGGLGIALGGTYPTPPTTVLSNDTNGHTGPNDFQDFPTLSTASGSSTDTSITGSFTEAGEGGKKITLDFYADPTADSSGSGQGQTYLGSLQVTTDTNGNAPFSVDFGTGNLAGEVVTATATDPSGNTSEFAKDITVTAASGSGYTSDYLQSLLPQSSTATNQLTIQTGPNLTQDTVISAVNNLTPPSQQVTIVLNLNGGTYDDTTVEPPANVTLIIDGANGSNTFVGNSPAFTVAGGNVIVRNVTFTTSTDAPTILVTGGSLTLRNDTIEESSGATDAAISITGGSLDLGTASNPGGNTLNVNGSGEFVHNTTVNPLAAVGDTFEINATPQSAASLSFTTLTSSTATTILNQPLTLTAVVRANGPSGTPTGSVDFFDATTHTDLGSAVLSGGVAALTTSLLTPGDHRIVAAYSGDANFLVSLDTIGQSVHYSFSGFLPPLGSNLSFAPNRTIPIKFQLSDYNGAYVSDPSAISSLQVLNSLGSDVLAGSGATSLRYDSTSNQFVYNWQTKGLPAGAYSIQLALDDGTIYTKALQLAASGGSANRQAAASTAVQAMSEDNATSGPIMFPPGNTIAPSNGSPSSVMDQVLAGLALLLSEARNAYQSELSSLSALWQNADALALQNLDGLLSLESGTLQM